MPEPSSGLSSEPSRELVNDTIFGRILRGEIPCDQVYADERCLAFRDVAAQAPVHILVIPREHLVSLAEASEQHEQLQTRLARC